MSVDKHNLMVNMVNDLTRQSAVLSMAENFLPHRAVGVQKVRLGSKYDGGYVMLDDFKGVHLALSLGIGGNASWDIEMLRRGMSVWQYDYTIDASPIDAHENLRFSKLKVVPRSEQGGVTIEEMMHQAQCESAILKIDIEHDEWEVFDACSVDILKCFTQVVVELHCFSRAVEPPWLARASRVLEKLNRLFAPVHVHANNWSPMINVSNVYFPETLEVSYANRARYTLEVSNEIFPTPIDEPNNPLLPDLFLGTFAFRPIGQRS